MTHWGLTPRESIAAECRRRGRDAVIDGCVLLLRERPVDDALVAALAGPGAVRWQDEDRTDRYWLRVWGARGLLWEWHDRAYGAIAGALDDPHWRVREMALKVVARHQLGDALPAAAELRQDPIPRVRAAAGRAVAVLTRAGA